MKPYFIIWAVAIVVVINLSESSAGEFQARYQPELDAVDLEAYLGDERRVRQQFKCILEDNAPCDAIGRWLKPRIAKAFLGECVLCTRQQVDNLDKINAYVGEKYPEEFRQIVTKYMRQLGIRLPEASWSRNYHKSPPPAPPTKEEDRSSSGVKDTEEKGEAGNA